MERKDERAQEENIFTCASREKHKALNAHMKFDKRAESCAQE